jgi:hypothetical protein
MLAVMGRWTERVGRWLGASETVPIDPSSVVEAALVPFADSQLVRQALEDEGIKSNIVDETRTYGMGGTGVPMARVFVAASDLEIATQIIEAFRT